MKWDDGVGGNQIAWAMIKIWVSLEKSDVLLYFKIILLDPEWIIEMNARCLIG